MNLNYLSRENQIFEWINESRRFLRIEFFFFLCQKHVLSIHEQDKTNNSAILPHCFLIHFILHTACPAYVCVHTSHDDTYSLLCLFYLQNQSYRWLMRLFTEMHKCTWFQPLEYVVRVSVPEFMQKMNSPSAYASLEANAGSEFGEIFKSQQIRQKQTKFSWYIPLECKQKYNPIILQTTSSESHIVFHHFNFEMKRILIVSSLFCAYSCLKSVFSFVFDFDIKPEFLN